MADCTSAKFEVEMTVHVFLFKAGYNDQDA